MKTKGCRKGYKYEAEMDEYRKWFTTGKKKTQYRNAVKLRSYCEWIGKKPEQLENTN